MPISTAVLQASASKTATFNTPSVKLPHAKEANVYIDVTAVTGTSPTLDSIIQFSPDDTTWYTNTTLTQVTTAGRTLTKIAGNVGKYLRVNNTIGGTTPDFTMSIVVDSRDSVA